MVSNSKISTRSKHTGEHKKHSKHVSICNFDPAIPQLTPYISKKCVQLEASKIGCGGACRIGHQFWKQDGSRLYSEEADEDSD